VKDCRFVGTPPRTSPPVSKLSNRNGSSAPVSQGHGPEEARLYVGEDHRHGGQRDRHPDPRDHDHDLAVL